jgi:hypothetical protein
MLFKSNEVIFSETVASRLVLDKMMLFNEFVFSIEESETKILKTFSIGIIMESSRSPIRKILFRR